MRARPTGNSRDPSLAMLGNRTGHGKNLLPVASENATATIYFVNSFPM